MVNFLSRSISISGTRALAGLTFVLILTSCAIAPPAPKSFANLGKFEQYQLNTAIFRVRFSGDADMSPATAEEIALLKAAKTTLDAGYRYFQVIDQSKPAAVGRRVVYTDPFARAWGWPSAYGYGGYRSRWGYYNSGWGWPNDPFYQGVGYAIDPVEVSYTIKCSNTPSQKGEEFDARLIMASLGHKYYLNADGTPRVMPQATMQKP
jgi:hypothetical protein